MPNEMMPNFATNNADTGGTVAEAINRLFRISRENLATSPAIAIATAYLNPGGFMVLADEIESAPRVRILLGAEPQEDSILASEVHSADEHEKLQRALHEYDEWLVAERDMLGFTRESSAAAERLVKWLRHAAVTGEPAVDIRRYNKGFLHGKAFIVDHDQFPAVLSGSSNMTYAGLKRNAELNLGSGWDTNGPTQKVRDWFELYWEQSDEFDLAAIYEARWMEHSPWTVFLRMLWELYSNHIEDEAVGATELKLTKFQADGVRRILRLLEEHNGVLVADEVGLGKTYLAGEIMARTTNLMRQKALIVCPAALKESMWEKFLVKHDLSRNIHTMSYDEIRIKSDPEHPEVESFLRSLDEFALVVIDEAHNLRNAGADRSKAIDAILGGVNPKKTILLTATPVNNSLNDLQTLIRYFIRSDSYFANIGIPSIDEYIKRAQKISPESLSPKLLFDLMDQVSVRRTRKFVKDNYPHDTITLPNGQQAPIVFPTPHVYRLDYELDSEGQVLLDSVIYALAPTERADGGYTIDKEDDKKLLLSRYTSSAYRTDGEVAGYQISNAGLLRTGLLKRLESSPRALHRTFGVLIKSHQEFLAALAAGYVLSGDALREWVSSDSNDLEEVLATFDDRKQEQVAKADEFFAEVLKADVEHDLTLLIKLQKLADKAASQHEPKVEKLIDALRKIAAESRRASKDGVSVTDRRKVIVFSSFVDTIVDLHTHLATAIKAAAKSDPLSDYSGRLPNAVTGSRAVKDSEAKMHILSGFAPRTAGDLDSKGEAQSKDKFDIILTTDVLAEGVNLQQAGRIINYDLPWNPMRIVQRHGRIDRIGSEHSNIYLGCFFPARDLDMMLNLEAVLQRKLAYAAASIGVGDVIPGQKSRFELSLADQIHLEDGVQENHKVIEQLHNENAWILENRAEGAALSGEEYRRRLAIAMDETFLKKDVLDLPYASGSGFVNPNSRSSGYVWCMKLGNHPQPWFAWTPTDDAWQVIKTDDGEPLVEQDVLSALTNADPGSSAMSRIMSDDAYQAAFDAWEIAQNSAWTRWQSMTDSAAMSPQLPLSMFRAVQFVFSYQGELSQEEKTDLLMRLNTTPRVATRRQINAALNSEKSDAEKLADLRDVVSSAGLLPFKAPEALKPIAKSDVRLVAWMAVKAGK